MKKIAILALLAIATLSRADNEIAVSASLTATKNYAIAREQPSTVTLNWNGDKAYQNVIVASVAPQSLTAGTFLTNGYAFFRNQSTNANVYWSFRGESAYADMMLKPGEYAMFRVGATTTVTNIKLWTTNSTASLYYHILED